MLLWFLPVLNCNSFSPSCLIETSSTDTLHPSLTLSCTSLKFLLGFCHRINLFFPYRYWPVAFLAPPSHSPQWKPHPWLQGFLHIQLCLCKPCIYYCSPTGDKNFLSPFQQVLEMLDCLNSVLVSRDVFHMGPFLSSCAVVYTLILYRKRDSRKKLSIYFHILHQRNNNPFFYAMELHLKVA